MSITEDGVVRNVVFRGVSSLFLGYTGTQTAFLEALSRRLGEPATAFDVSVAFPDAAAGR